MISSANIWIENFAFHDPYPAFGAFVLTSMNAEFQGNANFAGNAALPTVISNITFKNVTIAAASTMRVSRRPLRWVGEHPKVQLCRMVCQAS